MTTLNTTEFTDFVRVAANDIITQLGIGFTENIYHEALCSVLRHNLINYAKEVVIPVVYRGITVGNVRADIVTDCIVIECKVDTQIKEAHIQQLRNYLNLTGKTHGLLVNFNKSETIAEIQEINLAD